MNISAVSLDDATQYRTGTAVRVVNRWFDRFAAAAIRHGDQAGPWWITGVDLNAQRDPANVRR